MTIYYDIWLILLSLLAFGLAIFVIFKSGLLNGYQYININDISFKDALTKLPNRRAFQYQLEAAEKRSTRAGNTIALAYIDLDHFKPINDNYGHHVGDAMLASVARRLQAAVRGCDSVARLGGDEFVVLFEEIKSKEDITPIVERIVNSIRDPLLIDRHQIEISCSIGIAIHAHGGDIEKLMINADAAMYKAKENGRNQFKFFDAEIESATDNMLEMQHDLRVAIENNQFSLAFQPKIDCKTQSLVGAEALIRWNHPTKGVILPRDFIPAAEHLGFINQINGWVIEEACSTICRAKALDIDLKLSVNLSRQQFRNSSLVEETIKWLDKYCVPTQNLTFEIKEIVAIKNEAQFKLLLAEFKAANIKIALDDFGLHPFTLTYLQSLNVDELKLDRIFISKIGTDKTSKALIDAVIRLAHALNFNVVAEGIETEAQRDALTELGCDHMQGYLFSKPVSEDKLFMQFKQLQIHFDTTGPSVVPY
ncbi:MAG: EAL domain-containing protein [Methylotenera sp.]